MAQRAFVSRFSPNRTDPEVLEAIFVQRHRLAEVWLERLRDSVLTGAKHHLLAIGPRGCGKSHLVNLLIHRLRKDLAVVEGVRIAWLPEDETTPSFWKFLLRILRALNAEYGDEIPPPPRDRLDDVADDRRTAVLIDYLLEKLEGKTLLVVVENLDDAMRGLKNEGQKRWRAFLQEHPVAATLATAQQLTEDVSDRDRPFFNFFQIEHLQPLSSDEALSLLQKLAKHKNNTELLAFLQTPTGRFRVRAIRHLTGGSHRVFIILSEFATRENLDDLVTAFEELLDELTPYYQERLRWLPDQQREIVEFLCRQARTVPVKEIAGQLFLSEQTAAAQLKSLKDKGYVTAGNVGRESRYELAEPLMRLCVEVKDPRREPIRLIVDFLRVWYNRAGLEAWLQCLSADAELERRYILAALQTDYPDNTGPVKEDLNRDLEVVRATGDPKELVRVLVELAATADSGWRAVSVAHELSNLGRHAEALVAWERAIELDPKNAIPWSNKGNDLSELGRHSEALAAFNRAIELNPKLAITWTNKGYALNELGRHEEALSAFDRGIELDPKNVIAWNNRGYVLSELSRYGEALAAFDQAIELDRKFAIPWSNKGNALNDLGRHEEARAAYERVIELEPKGAFSLHTRAQVQLGLGQVGEAEANFSRAVELDRNFASAFEGLAEARVLMGNWAEAEKALSIRFRLPLSQSNPARSYHLPNLIVTIFRASMDRSQWVHRVNRLADIAQEAQKEWERKKAQERVKPASSPKDNAGVLAPPKPLAMLGDSLVRSLIKKAYAEVSPETLNDWANVWQEVAKRHPDLSLATRLFGVGVRYLRTKDERVLLDLVQEERAILRELFGLENP